MNAEPVMVWVIFSVFVVVALSLDTFFLEKKRAVQPHQSMRSALYWTAGWVVAALVFNVLFWFYIYQAQGWSAAHQKGLAFFTGYLIEKTLAVDNLFAFYIIFHRLNIPLSYQHRVFSYGIWGAVIFRLIFILVGAWLIARFHWILYLMGAFLLLTGIKMLQVTHRRGQNEMAEETPEEMAFLQGWMRRHFRITPTLHGQQFFVWQDRRLYLTPLFIALILIEFSDVFFALDSIPAIFAITTDPFIVWSSNIFAILGLRALYFFLAGMIERFVLLKYGVAFILVFIGGKMLIEPWLAIPMLLSLAIIASIIGLFVVLSLKRYPLEK